MVNLVVGALALELGHGRSDEIFVNFWNGLHVRGQDLGMLCEVDKESVACPAAFYLHYLEGGAPQQVLKSGANADAVPLAWVEACLLRCCCYCPYEFQLCEEATLAIFVEVGKEVSISGRLVELHVVHEGSLQV